MKEENVASEKENATSTKTRTPTSNPGSPRRSAGVNVNAGQSQQKIYGFILAMNDTGHGVKRIFGVGKNTINIGRGSKNDIRLNARMFSRLHVSVLISEEGDGLKVGAIKN